MLKVTKKKLRNGLTILLSEDRTVPTIAYHTLFKVGSRNERPGITGLSHLFEHMMFNGSAKFPPKSLDRIIEAAGGSSNAFTTTDTTEYTQEVVSSQIDKVIAIETDRMRSLLINTSNLEQERAIVKEERRASVEDQVESAMNELLWNYAFVAHPYRWEVVGFMRDLDAIALQDARDYFRTYYAPNNAVVVLVGDFDTAQMMRKLERAYGSISAQPAPRPVVNAEPLQKGEVRVAYERPAELPALLIGYKGTSIRSVDDAKLDVLTVVLSSGQSSRLNKTLVYDRRVATEVWAGNDSRLDPGLVTIYAQVAPEQAVADVEKGIDEVLAAILERGVSARELQKAKNGLRASFVDGFKTNAGIAGMLARYEGLFGDWKRLYDVPRRRDATTRADVQAMAKKYLVRSKRTLVELRPANAGGGN